MDIRFIMLNTALEAFIAQSISPLIGDSALQSHPNHKKRTEP